MVITRIKIINYIKSFFSGDSLTKKASLNALASALDYGARILIAFLITPWMVLILGDYFFGTWKILNQLISYLSPTSGKPTDVLKSTIANQQSLTNYEEKRRYVGATSCLWGLFLPIIGISGGLISWFSPYWLKTPDQYMWTVRIVAILLVANLAIGSLSAIPQSILEGENLGYKRIGLSVILVLLGGLFTWLALFLGLGIIGVASSALITTFLSGLLYVGISRKNIVWYGIQRPSLILLKQFLNLSWWFLSWNLLINVMISSDVILLGLLDNVESVTGYSLSKYAPETLISLIAIMVTGIIPGLGGIIGSDNYERVAYLRSELMTVIWSIVTIMGSSILIWNRIFLQLWVGTYYFLGHFTELLIVVVIIQYIFIRTDSNIIDLTLQLKMKVTLSVISVAVTFSAVIIFIKLLDFGIIGLCLGIILGRLIINIGFPAIIGRLLRISLLSQLKNVIRPVIVTICSFSLAILCSKFIPIKYFSGIKGWTFLFSGVGISSLIFAILVVSFGLSKDQRKNLYRRFRSLQIISKK